VPCISDAPDVDKTNFSLRFGGDAVHFCCILIAQLRITAICNLYSVDVQVKTHKLNYINYIIEKIVYNINIKILNK